MKIKKAAALIMAVLTIAAAGCASLLERSYSSEKKHYEQYLELGDSSVIEVDDYMSLKSAIMYFVEQAMESGTVRARDYDGNITDDLTEICLSLKEEPLGAYAVEYTSHEKISMVTYSEINVYFTYRRTKEEILSVENVSYYNIPQTLEEMLAAGEEYAAFSISYMTMSREELEHTAALAGELAGISEPVITVELYPDEGLQRIVEITVDYGLKYGPKQQRMSEQNRALDDILESLEPGTDRETCVQLLSALAQRSSFDADNGGDCAYDSLVEGLGTSLGYARALRMLCYHADIECSVVSGAKNGVEWYFNKVLLDGGTYYADPASFDLDAGETGDIYSEAEMSLQYTW